MKKNFLFAAVLCCSIATQAQNNFEGSIEALKITGTDTVKYVFYELGDKFRMDEFNSKTKQLETTAIGDIKYEKITVLNHAKKLQMNKAINNDVAIEGIEVEKTTNIKTIHGYKCIEYIVRNPADSTEIIYWLGKGKFNFYEPLVRRLGRTDNFNKYFLQIDKTIGMFPFEVVEKKDGVEVSRFEVTKAEKNAFEEVLFEIPKDYSRFAK